MAAPLDFEALIRSSRFLVVDDSHAWIRLMREVLFSLGVGSSRGAASVAEAQAVLAEQEFDMIISDLIMPGLDGFSLTRWIRWHEDPRIQGLPIAIMTSETSRLNICRASCCGVDMVIEKPLKPAVLLPRMIALLAGRPGTERVVPPCGMTLEAPCRLIPVRKSPAKAPTVELPQAGDGPELVQRNGTRS